MTAHDTLMDTLLESIALYQLIESMMKDQISERNRLAGLEFLWMVTNARSDRGAVFLRQSRLVSFTVCRSKYWFTRCPLKMLS